MSIARIEIEKGTEDFTTIIKIQFSPQVWNFTYNHSHFTERMMLSEEEVRKLEVREAVRKTAYMIERELRDAVKEQLGIIL